MKDVKKLLDAVDRGDPKGKEAFRHIGVLEKEKIVAKLKEIGMGT